MKDKNITHYSLFQVEELKKTNKKEREKKVKIHNPQTPFFDDSLPNWFTNIELIRKRFNEIKKLNNSELILFLDNKNFDERCQYILGLLDYHLKISDLPSLKKYKEELLYIKKINQH